MTVSCGTLSPRGDCIAPRIDVSVPRTDHTVPRVDQGVPRTGLTMRGVQILIAAFALLTVLPWNARGAGTPAGAVIAHQASATYSSPGWPSAVTVYSNTVNVIVAQVAVVNVTPPASEGESHVDATVDFPVTITNSGNGTDRFTVSAVSALALPSVIFWDMDGDGVLASEEVAAGPLTETRALPADSSVWCVVRINVPPAVALIGQTDQLVLTVVSVFDNSRSARGQQSTRIIGPAMQVIKGVNTPLAHGGDRVTYSIAYTNSGTSEAKGITVVDVLDPRLRFVGGAQGREPDLVAGQTLTWNLEPVQAGQEGSVEFYAEVAATAVPGDEVHNGAVMQYEDGPNTRIVESRESGFITIQSGGTVTVDVGPPHTEMGQPGDTIQCSYVVTNNGTFAEDFVLSTTSTLGLDWQLYQDLNANWKTDPGERVATTGMLQAGGEFTFIARTTLPRVAGDLTQDVMTLRAQSGSNSNNAKAIASTTTILLPRMTLGKQATAADPRTGREIVYTITYANEGSGQADGFVVSDAIPPNTVFVPGSVRVNGAAQTEQADGDGATLQAGVLSVHIGTVLPGSRGAVEFRVRIL